MRIHEQVRIPVDDIQYTERALGCERRLYRVAIALLRSDADAADAIQEAVFKGWMHREALRDGERFEAWLMRILVNECRNIQRKWKGRPEPLNEQIVSAQGAPDPALQDAIRRLPERLRLPLLLHHLEGYSLREISSILKIPETTAKSRLYQARSALRQALSPEVGR
jgi:RNA polymerase sigma-70 factor (ECF subfamily)